MASIISASTTSGTALNMSGDTSGVLQLATGATPTTAVTLDTSQNATFAGKVTSAGALTLASNGTTTAVTIDTSQNVGIGTTSPSVRLEVNAASNPEMRINDGTVNLQMYAGTGTSSAVIGTVGSHALVFRTNATERMRIDSSGNLLVGGTSAVGSSRLLVKGSGSSSATTNIYVQNSSGTDILYMRDDGAMNTGTTTSSPYNLTTGSGANAVLGSDGFLRRSTSSIKYKTDVQNAVYGLNEVMQLRPVTYKGKNDGNKKFGGLIAEEVDEIGLTEFVEYAEDGTPDALSYGHMVSLLTKAIQEQQTIINDLKARVETLEAK